MKQYHSKVLPARNDRLVGILLGTGLFLTQLYTAPLFSNSPIRFSDLGAILILLACTIGGIKLPSAFFLVKAAAIVGWSIIVFFAVAMLSPPIDAVNHFINVFRIAFGVLLVGMLSFGLQRTSPTMIAKAINSVFIIHIFVFFLYVFMFSWSSFRGFFNVVSPGDERNSLIAQNNLLGNHFRIIIADGEIFRFGGVFEEPAFFAWNMLALIACSIQITKNAGTPFNSHIKILAFACTTLFSRSFSGVFGMILLLIPATRRNSVASSVGAIVGAALLFFALLYLSGPSTWDRIGLLISFGDGSSNSRIIGSINAFLGMLEHSPLFGFGLGDLNKENAIEHIGAAGIKNGLDLFNILIIDIHNGIIQVGFSLGIIGLLAYVALLYPSLKAGFFYATGMFIVFFSSNIFNAHFIWIFIGLGAYAARLPASMHRLAALKTHDCAHPDHKISPKKPRLK